MYLVSILIPCYQERNFIGACLQSVQAFELPEDTAIEVFVLDGMSSDGTREIVSSLAEMDGRIRLIDNPRRSQAPALILACPWRAATTCFAWMHTQFILQTTLHCC